MITIATSNYWYFSFGSSLAVGGSRSISRIAARSPNSRQTWRLFVWPAGP
jgi:hypothetical protein